MIRKVLFTFMTLGLLVLGGCSDDDIYPIPGADGRTTLNLLIPTTEMAYANTRAERNEHSEKLASEGHFENISVIGFYKDNGEDKHFFAELTSEMATTVDEVYKGYKLAVVPAQYTLYVLANTTIDNTLRTLLDKKSLTATEMQDLMDGVKAMSYAYNNGDQGVLPTPAGGLPMAKMMTADLREGENKNVVIPMEFVCAKVRLTVIYNEAFGKNESFRINGLDVTDFYSPTRIFTEDGEHGTGSSRYCVNVCGLKAHYPLKSEEKVMTLDQWMDTPIEQNNNDLIDNITSGKEALSGEGFTSFCWQETAYIPEAVGTTAPTVLTLTTSKGVKTINIGCSTPATNHGGATGGKIERGNFYDIIAMVESSGEVTVKWRVQQWQTEQMTVQLAGLSNLYLNETHIARTEEEALSGENPIEIAYQSRAPIDFDIPKVMLQGFPTELPLFEVEDDAENQLIRVKLNSNLPQTYNYIGSLQAEFENNSIEGTPGFWVISGNIRKWVQVDYIDCSTYVRILPKTYDLAISNIANRAEYTMYLDYATNDNNLILQLTQFDNNNSSQASTSDTNNGLWLTICNDQKEPLSIAVPVNDALKEKDLLTIEMLSGVSEYPKDGYIALTILEPTSPSYFSKTISGTFTAQADNADPQTAVASFTISPIPTHYVIHFRDVNNSWTSPHIYVYQPLEYNGYEVYGKGKSDDANSMNWLEYSFTGNVTFKGWKKDGGSVPNLTISTGTFNNGEGVSVKGYNVGTDWGNPSRDDAMIDNNEGYYTHDIKLVDESKSSCTTCKSGSLVDLWPGIGMTKEIINGETWWRIELTLLAKPDKALVMFANGHHKNTSDEKELRYPAKGVPGLPLPDYSDREAWFLYDSNEDNHEFSDNKPKVAPNYANKKIYIRNEAFGWADGGLEATTNADGIAKFPDVAIGNKPFKIYSSVSGWHVSSDALTPGQEKYAPGNIDNTNFSIQNSTSSSVYDVEWNQKTKKIKVTLVSGTPTPRKAALYWYKTDFDSASQMLLFDVDNNDNYKAIWPTKDDWNSFKSSTSSGDWKYIIFSTVSELEAYDTATSTGGYQWGDYKSKKWSEGKHNDNLPDFLKTLGVTEAHQIWRD
ncbi:MAG: hypothetical protein K2H86_09260 [Muribaculaceae bacterium]|nr:hypothetical protein [Muribaculaceae bacterium]